MTELITQFPIDVYSSPIRQKPLLSFFLGKTVLVECDNGRIGVHGRLIRYENNTLIMKTLGKWCFIIIREWQTIGVM